MPVNDILITAELIGDVAEKSLEIAAAQDAVGDSVERNNKKSKEFTVTGNKLADALLKGRTEAKGFGFALTAMKIPTFIALFKTAVPAVLNLSAGIISLVSNMARMSGLAGALPGTILGLATAFGVFKLATSGVSEAIKEMLKPGAKLQDVQNAMRNMPASAQAFAVQIGHMRPMLKELKASAADAFLPGLGAGVSSATGILPTVNRMLSSMGLVMGDLARQAGKMIGSSGWSRDLNQLGATNAVVLQRMGAGLLAVVDALRHVAVAAQPMTLALGDLVKHGGEWLRTQAQAGRDSGKLTHFFNQAVETMKQWGRILANVGVAVYNVFHGGAKLGGDLANSLERITFHWRQWTGSAAGGQRILRFFNDAREPLHELALLGSALVASLFRIGDAGQSGVAPFLRTLRVEGVPALEKMVKGMGNDFLPSLIKLAAVLARLVSFTSFEPLITATAVVANLTLAIMKVIDTVPGLSQLATAALTVAIAFKTWHAFSHMSGIEHLITSLTGGPTSRGLSAFIGGLRGSSEAVGVLGAAGLKLNNVLTAMRMGLMGVEGAEGLGGLEGAAAAAGAAIAGPAGIIALIAVGVALLVGGLVLAYFKVKWFHDGVNAAARGIANGFMAVVDFFERIPGMLERVGISIFNAITWPFRTSFNAIADLWNDTVGRIPIFGSSIQVGHVGAMGGGLTLGDESRPRSGGVGAGHASSNMAKTMAVFRHVDSITPGRRMITSGYRTFALGSGNSDHARGRALDLTGSNLGAFRQNLAAIGGYGAMHGDGPGSHLHMAIGDETRPRAAAMMGGGNTTLIVQGPLVNFEREPSSEMDITNAVYHGIEKYNTEKVERRGGGMR